MRPNAASVVKGVRPLAPAVIVVLAIVLLPFVIAGRHTDAFVTQLLHHAADRGALTAAVVAGALAVDILLPIPSSLLATGAGFLLGFANGTAATFGGLMAGSIIGYTIGRIAIPAPDPDAHDLARHWGDWAIAVTRPIPVLAESATLLAGTCRMPFRRFMAVSALSNLCVAAAYAAAGSISASRDAPLLALVAACALPAAAMAAMAALRRGPIVRS